MYKDVEVPVTQHRHVPVTREVQVEVPVPQIQYEDVQIPVPQTRQIPREVQVPVPVTVQVPRQVPVPRYVDVPYEVIEEVQVPRHVPVPVPVTRQVYVDVPQPVDQPFAQLVHSIRDVPVRDVRFVRAGAVSFESLRSEFGQNT